jgi:hypothetical protein
MNIITTLNSTDKYMIFTTNPNTFTVPSGGLNCDILMIGGGGSGGQYGGGGSGACIIAINQTLPSGVCSVVVGSAGTTSSIAGNSSITINNTNIRYLAIGGGRGGNTNLDGENGGCGGGAGSSSGATREGGTTLNTNIVNGTQNISPTGPTTSGINYAVLGNVGGKQLDKTGSNSRFSASGGGGIGSPGVSHNNGKGASGGGGSGLNEVTINTKSYNFKSYFANNESFGHNNNGYIGGGGSGAAPFFGTSTGESLGGGGAGSKSGGSGATLGAVNTGSGGGGASKNGGTGIVIIRYRYPTIPISS